jgi:hypothetical protein
MFFTARLETKIPRESATIKYPIIIPTSKVLIAMLFLSLKRNIFINSAYMMP